MFMRALPVILAVLVLGLSWTQAPDVSAEDKKLKVAFALLWTIDDQGWTTSHYNGIKALQEQMGDRIEVSYTEKVLAADAERVFRDYAQKGYDIIFGATFEHMDPLLAVANDNPEIKFEHCSGFKSADNMRNYFLRMYQGEYLAGYMAGLMGFKKVGTVATQPIPEPIRGINAFTIALRKVNPTAEVRVVWVNSWYDPGKEADAAKALIDQGADVILQHTDSPAAVQAAEERGVYAVGQASDMSKFGPKAHLTAIVDVWDEYYVQRARAVLDGSWQSGDTWGGFDQHLVQMSPYNEAIPADVVTMAEQAQADIVAGSLHPFEGPIIDQQGRQVIGAGARLTDEELLAMDYYVEGVLGELPK